MKIIAPILLICVAYMPLAAHAQISVGSAAELRRAIERSDAGDEITLAAGDYEVMDLKLPRDITLRGVGEVVFFSRRPVAKGLLNPLPGASIRIENIKFTRARSPDQNGAGIRHDGDNLTVIDSEFEDNENGILSTGSEDGRITIHNSKFLRSGYGDGYSHGIYVVRAASLQVQDTQFIGTRAGHHVKSLANATTIRGSSFDDADGRTSYAVDASNGGDVEICDNNFIQAANADNSTIINYDLSRGGESGSLTIANNRFINHRRSGKLLRNGSPVEPQLYGNEITNKRGATLDYPEGATLPAKAQ